MKIKKVVDLSFWAGILLVYVLAVFAIRNHAGVHRALLATVGEQREVIARQLVAIDSLEALLHVQVVDMADFGTLCYLKTPLGVVVNGDTDAR